MLKFFIYEVSFFLFVSQCLKLGFFHFERWVEISEKIDWKTQIECLIDDESIDFVKGIDVAVAMCNMKCSPLIGMLVQGFIELLRMIMIGMNPICVWKILWNGKDLCISYAHCENGQISKFLVKIGCSILLKSSTSTCIESPLLFSSSPPCPTTSVEWSKNILELGHWSV